MLPYVQLEGAGEDLTQITGAGQSSPSSGVVIAANNSQIRDLTVQSRAGNTYSTGIYADNTVTATSRIRHVTVRVADGSTSAAGIFSNGGAPVIEQANVIASNATAGGLAYGISLSGNGAQVLGGTIQAQSSGTGQVNGIYVSAGSDVLISNVQITVSTSGAPVNTASPDAVGIGSISASYAVQGANITASTTGGGLGLGLALNNGTSSTVNTTVENGAITVTTSGVAFTQGILNNTAGGNPVNLVVRGTSITLNAGNKTNCQGFGVNTFGAPVAIYNSTIDASVGTGCLAAVGLIEQGSPNDLTFNNGYIKSTNYALYNSSATAKIKVGSSQLSAPIIGSGTAVCINDFKSDYTATTGTCG